jgi:hypothetical protein
MEAHLAALESRSWAGLAGLGKAAAEGGAWDDLSQGTLLEQQQWQRLGGVLGLPPEEGDALVSLTVHAPLSGPAHGSGVHDEQQLLRAQARVHDPLLEGYGRLLSSCASLETAVHRLGSKGSGKGRQAPAWQRALALTKVRAGCAVLYSPA